MFTRSFRVVIRQVALALPLLAGPLFAAERPSIAELFGPGFLHSAFLSPDGAKIAGSITLDGDAAGLYVHDLATRTTSVLKGTDELDVYRVYWHGNDRLLFNVSKDKRFSHGLYSAPTGKLSDHIPIRVYDAMDLVAQPAATPDRVVIWTRHSYIEKGKPGDLEEISVAREVDSKDALGRPFQTNIRVLSKPPGIISGFESTPDGRLALAFVVRDGATAYLYWDQEKAAWQNPPEERARTLPVACDPDPAYAWIVTRDPTGGSQLRRMHLATGRQDDPVHTDTRFDLERSALKFSRLTGQLVGLRYQRQRATNIWFSPKFAAVQATLDERLPKDEDHVILDWDDTETRFVVGSGGPRQPGIYRVYDPAADRLEAFGETAPALAGKKLQSMRPIKFIARDGVELEGYLTLPDGISKAAPAPVVVLVHGGPRARDTLGFDREAQFLASLGYAVLQPNYRGSSGYLWPEDQNEYETAFSAMRDDVIDATRTLLKNELFDSSRVAIMGGSFGGYLALACSVEETDLYRCAISVCGVFDWAEHVRSKRRDERARPGEYEKLVHKLGDPRDNRSAYEAISPLHRVDRLRIPMLVAHGKIDSIVSIQQSRRLVRELKSRKLTHETFFRPLAGHGFYAAEDRLDFYRLVDRFLAANLTSPTAAPTP